MDDKGKKKKRVGNAKCMIYSLLEPYKLKWINYNPGHWDLGFDSKLILIFVISIFLISSLYLQSLTNQVTYLNYVNLIACAKCLPGQNYIFTI
ncbi:unnamed protein product [Prunus armeniaca]